MDNMIKYWLLCLLKAVVWLLDIIANSLFGYTFTRGSKQDQIKANNYEHSAQIVKVLWKAKETDLKWCKTDNFLYKHERYVHPNFVLKNKNATLLTVDKNYAMFSVTDPDVDIYDSTKYPFLFMWQFFEAKRLVIIPINSFHRLADELGDPKVPVTMMAMSARCGSTLLVQAFKRVPGTRAMSEPWAMHTIHVLRALKMISPDESRRLIKSAIRLHCKVEPGANVDRIFMKMNPYNGYQFQDFAEMFPKITFLFNTRHPKPSLKSYKQVYDAITADKNYYFKYQFFWREIMSFNVHFPYDGRFSNILSRFNKWYQNVSYDELMLIHYPLVLDAYFQSKDIYSRAILYENLAEDPEKELSTLFDIMNIDHKHLPLALEAFKRDSQNGTFGQRMKNRSYQLDGKNIKMFDDLMKEMGMPEITHDMSVEGFKKLFGV